MQNNEEPKRENGLVSLGFLLIIGIVVFVLDQSTKYWVLSSIPVNQWWSPLPVLERIVKFTHTTNSGAAFGILPNAGNFFIFVAIIVAIAIIFFYHKIPAGNWLIRISLGLQLGGALGNLIDRLRYGYVVDFVDIGFWPIFNIADSSILIGVILLVYSLWRAEQQLSQSAQEQEHSIP